MVAGGGAAMMKPAQMQSARLCVWCRRDLTINSLFYNINTREVEDFTGKGLDDLLEHKLIRTPLPPSETFRDGALHCFLTQAALFVQPDAALAVGS